MADLGAIGVAAGVGHTFSRLDIALAWNITNNPIACHEVGGAYRAVPKREDWKVVSGTVRDASDAPAARGVRAVDRTTGRVLGTTTSDAGTGAYAIAVPSTSEVQVVFNDDAAGDVENDIILRTFPV